MAFLRNLLITAQQSLPKDSVLRQAWRKFMPPGISSRVRQYLVRASGYLQALDRIGYELDCHTVSVRPEKQIRVLFGPSFSIYTPCFIHDRILSYALRLRGAEVIPMYCDAVQSVECNVYGGVWMGQIFEKSCRHCVNMSQTLWQHNPIPALRLSTYLQRDEIEEITTKVEHLDTEEWVTYTEDGLPFGLWAKDILVNNYVVGDYHLVPDYHSLGLAHLRNLLLLKAAYEKIIVEVKPDRVIANDSYYGMWAILQKLCERKDIPFYSHYIGSRKDTWCYAFNDAAASLDFSKPWEKFSRIPLNEQQRSKVRSWLDGRPVGKEMIFDSASLGKHLDDEFDLSTIDPKKPTALLVSSAIWDLGALNKQIIFADMIDWIAETIQWFAAHPEFQLIIRTHPGEMDPRIPITEERVEVGLARRGVYLPANVFLLSPKVALTVYQLFPLAKVGIVHTTTVGIEMAAISLPVITTARSHYSGFGFTIDPASQEEYFELLERTLRGEKTVDLDAQVDLAYKFILFQFYHYYTRIDIMDYFWGQPAKLKVHSLKDLLPGNNKYLDYVLDSIMAGLPIVSEVRWPSES